MSVSFPTTKTKRLKSSSRANDSFVKNVKSRVTGLLPATITKWFSNQSSSSANGSAALAESTDSSTEDETPESPTITQPAAKRMRYSSPPKTSHLPIHTKCTSTNTESIEVYSSAMSPSGRNSFRREPNFVSTPIQSNKDEATETENTVNRFNLHSPLTINDVSIDRKRKSLFDKTQDFESTFERAVARTPSARQIDLSQPHFKAGLLCSPFYSGRTTYGGAASSFMNRPNIKHRKETLVKNMSSNDPVTISHSARRVMDILENYSSPLREAKRIPQFTGTQNNNTNSFLNSSDSNKKCHTYKTQELHVPRIASIIRLKQKSRLMDSTNVARQIIASHSSSTEYTPYPNIAPSSRPTDTETEKDKLTTKLKSRLSRINRNTQESSVPTPVNLPTISLQIDQDNLPKFSLNPVQTSSTSTTIEADNTSKTIKYNETNVQKGRNLPDKLPQKSSNEKYKFSSPVKISMESEINTSTKFSFGSPERGIDKAKSSQNQIGVIVSHFPALQKTKDGVPTNRNTSKLINDNNNRNFKDASATCNTCKVPIVQNNDNNKCLSCHNETANNKNLSVEEPKNSSVWKCADCWVQNNNTADKCICCGGKKPSNNNKEGTSSDPDTWTCECSVHNKKDTDHCVSCKIKRPSSNTKEISEDEKTWKCADCWVQNKKNDDKCVCCGGNKNGSDNVKEKSPVSESWKCADCWVQNNAGVDKCVCCGSKKPSGTKNDKSQSSITTSKENEITSTTDWKCNDCWIKNKAALNKCAACGGAKPGLANDTNIQSTNIKNSSDNTPLQIVKSQASMWECSTCLVRNENNRITCVCCEGDKPGSKKELGKNLFSFNANPGAVFKFGINPKENIPKKDKDKSVPLETKESEANNNNILPKASFKFGIVNDKEENIKSCVDNKKEESTKDNFTLNVVEKEKATTSSEPPKTLISFLSKQTDSNVNKTIDNSLDATKVESSATKLPEVPPNSSNLFSIPVTSQSTNNPETLTSISPMVSAPITDVNKGAPNIALTQKSVTAAEIKVPQTTFKFSAVGNKPSVNLFTPPVSQVSSTNLSFTLPSKSIVSNVTTLNKTEPINTGSIALFQKSESLSLPVFSNTNSLTTTVVSQPPITSATSIFSFSSNQNTGQSSEKPQFNFTLGSTNKTESASLFKTSFGSINDSNKFSLPTANTLGSTNVLTGTLGGTGLPTNTNTTNNILTGMNGLPSGNPLGSIELSTNPLNPGNPLQAGGVPALGTPATGLFGSPIQKENMWSAKNTTTTNLFASNPNTNTTNALQKPGTFTFGTSPAFNANNSNTAFGTSSQQTQNVFGITNQNSSSQTSLFSNTIQNPTSPNIFGSPAPTSNTTPGMGLFGSPIGSAPNFGNPNPSIPSFEASVTPTPSFNFGSQQTTPAFSFSQQQPQVQQQAGSVYNFGAGTGSTPQVQFNMGSVPNITGRRVRKAIRRTTQR